MVHKVKHPYIQTNTRCSAFVITFTRIVSQMFTSCRLFVVFGRRCSQGFRALYLCTPLQTFLWSWSLFLTFCVSKLTINQKNIPRSGNPQSGDTKERLDGSPSPQLSAINIRNIRRLRSNLTSFDHHLSAFVPHRESGVRAGIRRRDPHPKHETHTQSTVNSIPVKQIKKKVVTEQKSPKQVQLKEVLHQAGKGV